MITVANNDSIDLGGLDALRDHCQALASRLRHPAAGGGSVLRSIGVASCARHEGVTTVATGLAVAAARLSADPVLLIDANFSNPALHAAFGLSQGPGLAEVLMNEASLAEVAQVTPLPNLKILTAGEPARLPRTPVDPAAFGQLVDSLWTEPGLVVVDLPPVDDGSAAWTFAGVLAGTLLVVEAERIHAQAARRAKTTLEQQGAHLLGVVFNKRNQHIPSWLYRNW